MDKKEKLELLKRRLNKVESRKKRIQDDIKAKESKVYKYEMDNKACFLGIPGKEYLGKNGKWELNPLQKDLIKAWSNHIYKVLTYTGANQIGKTFIAMIVIESCMIGRFPWQGEEMTGWMWDLLGWEPPILIRWVGQDWEKHIKTVLLTKIEELWPKSREIYVKSNSIGVKSYFKDLKTGSTLEIMSNRQDSALFEGWVGNLVVYDEPPRREVRVACARGLMANKGRELFCMTLLNEPWIDLEVINRLDDKGQSDETVLSLEGKIENNEGFGLTREGIDQYIKTLTPEEQLIRIKGESLSRQRRILNIKKEIHIKDKFRIPPHWVVDIAIDIGIAKPNDIHFLATDELGRKYLFEHLQVSKYDTIADEIYRVVKRDHLRIHRIITDPLCKSDKNNENTVFERINRGLNKYGFYLETANKSKEDGIATIKSHLETINGDAALFIFRNLGTSVNQLINWMRDEKGIPIKDNDDTGENLYRLMLLNTQYSDPDEEEEYISRGEKEDGY